MSDKETNGGRVLHTKENDDGKTIEIIETGGGIFKKVKDDTGRLDRLKLVEAGDDLDDE